MKSQRPTNYIRMPARRAASIATPPIPRAAGRTRRGGMAAGRRIGYQSPGWSVGRAARSGYRCASTVIAPACSPSSKHTRPDTTVNTDEWRGYDHLPETRRSHATACHTPSRREWARDDDGDGVREGHNNTMEGIWTGLRNFLRPFRGVSKWFLSQYVTIFEWAHNLKRVTTTLLRAMMVPCTSEPT